MATLERLYKPPVGEVTREMKHIELMLSEKGPYSVLPWRSIPGFYGSNATVQSQFLSDLNTLGNLVGSYGVIEMAQAVNTDTKRENVRGRTNRRAMRIFSPEWEKMDPAKREEEISSYASIANAFINDYFRTGGWQPLADKTDLHEEAEGANSIPRLMDIMLNNPRGRVRFEAKRKLVLMQLAATAIARGKEINEKEGISRITELLNEDFWFGDVVTSTRGKKKIKTKRLRIMPVDIESHHSYETLECIGEPTEISSNTAHQELQRIRAHVPEPGGYFIKVSHYEQRFINYEGELIPVYQDSRPKRILARMAKMIRKEQEDPAIAVQDTTGLMFVVKDIPNAYKLLDFFTKGGENGALTIKVGDLEDTLSGKEEYSAENEGSSPKTRQLKFIATIEGHSVEVIIHTFATQQINELENEVAHEEFELKRDIEVYKQNFPKEIYHVDPEEELPSLIDRLRRRRRASAFAS